MKLFDDGFYTLEADIKKIPKLNNQNQLYEFTFHGSFSNDIEEHIRKYYLDKQTLLQLSEYIKTVV